MTELIIRRAGLGDLNAVAQVEAACFPPAEAASRDSLAKRLTAYGDSFLVAEQDGEIIGFINGSVVDNETITDAMFDDISLHQPDGRYQAIFGLDVLPAYRSKGLGKEAFAFIEALAARENIRRLRLEVEEDNVRARSLYERLGYRPLEYGQMVKELG